jgi:hypothetical protein
MGLSLLSQPAQALNWNFSYTTNGGNSFTGTLISDGSSAATNTIYNLTGISGTVTNNGSSALVSALGSYGGADNKFVWGGGTAIALTVNGISFTDANAEIYNLYFGSIEPGTVLGDFSTNNLNVANTANTGGTNVTSSSLTPATAVPWETDALPVIGSTILFAGGLWAKRKFAKPLQK